MRTTRYRSAGGAGGPGIPTECTPTAVFAETFGIDDTLKIIYSLPSFFDTYAVTEDALGVKVGLFDTVGADDRLTLAQIATRFADTFGADDRLTKATIVSRYIDTFGVNDALVPVLKSFFAETFGIDDALSLVTLISRYVDTVGVTDNLGTTIKLFDTFGVDDRLTFADLFASYADTFGADDRLSNTTLLTTFTDTFGMDDRLAFVDVFTTHPDTFGVDDSFLGVGVKGLIDTFGVADAPSLFTVTPVQLDTFGITDDFPKAQFRNVTFQPTATPDTDPSGDSFVDQANPTTNTGLSETAKVKGKSTLGNDELRGLLEFDFTRYSNMTAFVGGTHELLMQIENMSALLSVDITVQLSRLAARPFTESTVTWNNQPAAGTVIKSQVFTIPAGSLANYTMTLTDAQMNDLLGDWGYVRVTAPTTVAPPEVRVTTRDFAGTRPRWSFDLKL